ncbi:MULTISPECIES: MarR family winged helix-turn-helix transcriptional regulator [Deinococcus]|uniref:MarR family winged helix-turn-helix transcriptional regulator n=1 Tax=Deinococcus rufus TaxID=2136097 RepID=A0ABV7Z8I6_9DEIO|nr:MarR family winged helix-turn-helix transcriptional regulator [Deinococcus sp. AB2017081]WQE96297.1 MarR family winged helix-turn-helix transcriptional regulator [Deinococcus sp. AB2017081]
MPHTPAGAAFTDLVLEVLRLNGLLTAAGDRLSAPAGQTSGRWQVMGCIDDTPRTVAAVARLMGLTRQSVQRTADLLVAEGLAETLPNPEHKRAHLLRLTLEGQRALTTIETAQYEWANGIGAGLDEQELQVALSVLARVTQAVGKG